MIREHRDGACFVKGLPLRVFIDREAIEGPALSVNVRKITLACLVIHYEKLLAVYPKRAVHCKTLARSCRLWEVCSRSRGGSYAGNGC